MRFNRTFLTPTLTLKSKEIKENIRVFPLIFSKDDHLENEKNKFKATELVTECTNIIRKKETQKIVKENDMNLLAESFA